MAESNLKILILYGFVTLVLGQPVINNQPLVANLKEATFIQIPIVDIPCVDPTDLINGRVAVTVLDVTSAPVALHCQNCFKAYSLNIATPNDWKLYFNPGKLDYFTASRYDIRVTCRDSVGLVSPPAVIGVSVIPNAPPYFNPTYRTINVTNSATRIPTYSIGTETATDGDGDPLFYTMSTSATTDIFQINAATGEITLLKPLGGLCRNNIVFYIEAVDNFNPERAKLTLNVNFLQMNLPGVITNMNRVISFPENAPPSSIPISRVDVYEQAFSCLITVQVSAMQSKIAFNPISESIDVTSFNYELDSNTNITVQCTDGLCPSTAKWLYVQIQDINDNPRLDPPSQSLTVAEGYIDILPNLIITDEDITDPHVFYIISINPAVAGFTIDKDTGRLRTTTNFRVDQLDQIILDFLIAADDTKGNQPTNVVSVRLTVYDINDNRPILVRTSFEYILEECYPLGVLDTLTANDQDGGVNGVVEFESGVAGSIIVSSNGAITLSSAPVSGSFHTVEIYAMDQGYNPGVQKSPAPAVITIIGIPCPMSSTVPAATTQGVTVPIAVTTPTQQVNTLPPNQRKNNTQDLIWIAGACVLGLVVACLIIFILYRCHNAARSRQKRMRSSMADLTPRKNSKPVKPDNIRRKSSTMAEAQTEFNKQSQNDYFKNDVRDVYKDSYKKNDLPSAV